MAALCAGLVVTALVWLAASNLATDVVRSRFSDKADTSFQAIEDGIRFYLDEIRDVAAFSQARQHPEAEPFQVFVERTGMFDEIEGDQFVLYLERVPRTELDAMVEERRAGGDHDFDVVVPDPSPDGDALVLVAVGHDGSQLEWPVVDLSGLPSLAALLDDRTLPPGSVASPDLVHAEGVEAELRDALAGLRAGGLGEAQAEGLERVLSGLFGPSRHAIAVPVTDDAGGLGGWVVADLLPSAILGAAANAGDVHVAVSVVDEGVVSALLGVEGQTGDLTAEQVVHAEGIEWLLEARSSEGFGSGTVATARRVAAVVGLLVSAGFAAMVLVNGRAASTAEEIREELGVSQEQARRDALTGLVNRTGLIEAMERCLAEREGGYLAVLFVDIDRLKVVNDSLGHAVGDRALQEIARRFSRVGRWSDTVARFGGDEFVFLCPGLQRADDSARIGEQVLLTLADPIEVDGMELVMTASIGVAVASPGAETDPESLVRDADTAMYEAKSGGGNRVVVFDHGLRVKLTGRLEVERSLRSAVDNGDLDVHFQPIVDAESGRIVAAEALVRWFTEDGKPVSPATFIPVAAETGMVVRIGDFVIQRACLLAAELERMHPADPPIGVTVNVAERQLLDPGFVDRLRQLTQAARIWPNQITLEITEDVVVDRLGRSMDVLRKLADIGFGLAIDDFGTGLSSLGYVKRLDMVETLKIDRSFIVDVTRDPADQAIVSAIVAMARSLGLTVVAEGVEEPAQAELLRSLGVPRMQGFLWSKAVPANEFCEMVAQVHGWGRPRDEAPLEAAG